MPSRSPRANRKSRRAAAQKDAEPAQELVHLDANSVQRVGALFQSWRDALETRNPDKKFVSDDRRMHWQRAIHPAVRTKRRTWLLHVAHLRTCLEQDWNESLRANEH